MGPHVETKESAAPALLVLSTESILVRTTLCGVDTPRDGVTANLTRATWGARCGKSARRVLRGGTGTSGLTARLVPTHHVVLEYQADFADGCVDALFDINKNAFPP